MTPVTFFIDDKLGGVSSLNLNLMRHAPEGLYQTVIHVEDRSSNYTKACIQYPVDREMRFVFDKKSNVYDVLKRMRRLLPDEDGALVLNYGSEMAMLDHHPVKQTTYQLVHDSYNLRLAEVYGHVVDVFICHNSFIESELLKLYPERREVIFFLSHGVNIPAVHRKKRNPQQPLQLLFLGRLTETKGIYDLPVIAALLREKGIPVKWTCIGAGPEEEKFKNSWSPEDEVAFLSPKTNEEVIDICAQHDVFVLPTKFEGTPVSLLETMSVGLVPVITALPGGITEIVTQDVGYTIPMDDNAGFAEAIANLYRNNENLEAMSTQARNKVIADFNINHTAKRYYGLFVRFAEFKKEKHLKKIKVGSKLDQHFLPEMLTRTIRKIISII